MSETAKQLVYLLDASGFIHRAYHAIRAGLKTADGTPTHAVFGFANMLVKLIKDRRPAYLVPVFDVSRKSFRQDLYAPYKATRPPTPPDLIPQFGLIRELVAALGLPPVEREGFEADDLLGSLARQAVEEGHPVWLISSDKDLMQLVSDKDSVALFDPWKDRDIHDAEVRERFGVEPAQVIDVQALAGDSSDNVPGMPGIGEKTAAGWIAEFGSLEALLERADELKSEKKRALVREHAELARLSKTLVTIRRDLDTGLDLETFRLKPFTDPKLAELLTRLEFTQLLKVFALTPTVAEKAAVAACAFDRSAYALIDTEAAAARLLERLNASECTAFDCETHTLDALSSAPLVGLSFAFGAGDACYVPLDHRYLGARNVAKTAFLENLKPIFADTTKTWIAHNAKFDLHVLESEGLEIAGTLDDSMLLSYVLDPSRRTHGLDALTKELLGHEMIPYDEVAGKGRGAITFADVDTESACRYSAEDADAAWRLFAKLWEQVETQGLGKLYTEMERPLLRVLAGMERSGIRIDRAALAELSRDFDALLKETEQKIYALAGETFNIQSPAQLGVILFDKLGLPTGKKTKTGYSTDVVVLQRLAPLHPLPELILDYRQNAKLRGTYTEALQAQIDPRDGRVHGSFNQTVTLTGRLSSSHPNLQNIPVRSASGRLIRRAFIAAEGCELLSADYSQIELRLLAHLAQDPILTTSFKREEDIHTRTAAEVFGVLPGLVDKELRRRAKAINFGIVYGQTAFGLAETLGIPPREAKRIIEEYFARYAGVRRYIEERQAQAHEDKVVHTLWNRRIPVVALEEEGQGRRQYGERVAINAPIQGSAADLVKLAMLRVDAQLRARKLKTKLLVQVHDELLLDVPKEEIEEVRELVRAGMEEAATLAVPLRVDIGMGASWAAAHG